MALRLRTFYRLPAAIAGLGLALLGDSAGAMLQIDLESGTTHLGALRLESVEVHQREETEIVVSGIAHPELGDMGELLARCRATAGQRCLTGTLTWTSPEGAPGKWSFQRLPAAIQLANEDDATLCLQWSETAAAMLNFRNLGLDALPAGIRQAAGLSVLSGRLDGMLEHSAAATRAKVGIRDLGFDTPDGRFAGAGLAFDLDLLWQSSQSALRAEGEWKAGEVLLGAAYLPAPNEPVKASLVATQLAASGWRIERARLLGPGMLDFSVTGRLALAGGISVDAMDVELANADLSALWRQGLNSLAAAQGWGQLQPAGRAEGRLRVEANIVRSFGLRLADVAVGDDAGRLDLRDFGAWVEWNADGQTVEANASWADARLFRVPLGASAIGFDSRDDGSLALSEPFRLPVLDGALVLERLRWRDWLSADRQLDLDARLEPVDLGQLTQTLGWTEFGGRISGRFPGVRLAGSAFAVQGGLDIDLFDGTARIEHLSIERPFGSLPALAADVEFEALDLEQVTGAFEFGRMLGLLSGHVRDLRLLDWQPVRFDAWFETLEDSPKRRISQQAVDSISTISGGGGAALSGTLLNFFEDFPYRKAGLGCRLENNVCRMNGLRETDKGGYMILEGRALPRLDIVGFKRRVDWPRLLAQIAAATGSSE